MSFVQNNQLLAQNKLFIANWFEWMNSIKIIVLFTLFEAYRQRTGSGGHRAAEEVVPPGVRQQRSGEWWLRQSWKCWLSSCTARPLLTRPSCRARGSAWTKSNSSPRKKFKMFIDWPSCFQIFFKMLTKIYWLKLIQNVWECYEFRNKVVSKITFW